MNIIGIALQPLLTKDKKQLLELFTNEKVLQSYSKKPIKRAEQIDDFFNQITTKGCQTWKIVDIENNHRFLGVCSRHHYIPKEQSIEIGGTLFPQYWGKGIMLNAFQLLIKQVEQELNVKYIIGKTKVFNEQAIKLVKKIGFDVVSKKNKELIVVKKV